LSESAAFPVVDRKAVESRPSSPSAFKSVILIALITLSGATLDDPVSLSGVPVPLFVTARAGPEVVRLRDVCAVALLL
jgi:hypothetical protein